MSKSTLALMLLAAAVVLAQSSEQREPKRPKTIQPLPLPKPRPFELGVGSKQPPWLVPDHRDIEPVIEDEDLIEDREHEDRNER